MLLELLTFDLNKMIKVLYAVSTLKRTGPVNQLFNIIKNLDRRTFEPYLITLSSEPEDSKLSDFESLDLPIICLNLSRAKGFFLAQKRIETLIDDIKPDLIHTQGFRADVLSSKLKTPAPKVATIRNYPQNDFVMTYGNLVGRLMAKHQIVALRKIDICVGVSEAVSSNLKSNFSIENSIAIPNGVDEHTYKPVALSDKANLRRSLSLPIDPKIWIASGHLSARKDPLFLIEAWKSYFKSDDKNILIFIGDGDLAEECKKAIQGNQNILLLGRVQNVAEYLQAADYYVSSSKAEGLPNAALEALACGLPLLLSKIGPHEELITAETNIGKTYELGSKAAFHESCIALMNENYEEMRRSSIQIVNHKFSSVIMSENYQALYKHLLKGK